MTYRINSIYRALQGEGFWTGTPCTLVRFQGCNLSCWFCDTAGAIRAGNGTEMSLQELANFIGKAHVGFQMVLLTGGEPLLQDIEALIPFLQTQGPIHVETNGTLPIPEGLDWVTMSPKPERDPAPGWEEHVDEVKWLVSYEDDVGRLREFLAAHPAWNGVPFVQPVWDEASSVVTATSTKICYEACLKYGWRLSLQTHKLIGRP